MIKRIASFMLVATMTVGLITGCGSKTESGSTTASGEKTQQAEPKKDAKLVVSVSQGWVRDIDKQLATKFTEKTGIKVDLQANPDNQYLNVVKAKLQAGEGPDIFYGRTGFEMLDYNPAKYALDLSKESWVSKYPEYMKDQVYLDGKVIGFCTWGRDFRAMIYNSEIFNKLNIKVPTNYAEFTAACDTLLKNDVTPVYFPGKEDWYCGMNFDGAVNIESKAAGSFNKLNKGEMKYADSSEAESYLARLQECAKKGYFGKNFMSDTFDKGPAQLSSGKYAMWYGWATYVNDIAAAGGPTADKYLAFPTPYTDSFDTLAMTGAGLMRMINKDSKNIEEAKKFLNFLAEEANLQAYYDGRPDLLESTMKGATAKAPANFTAINKMTNGKTVLSPTMAVKFTGADVTLGKNIQNLLIGNSTPKKVLESIDAAREKLIKVTSAN